MEYEYLRLQLARGGMEPTLFWRLWRFVSPTGQGYLRRESVLSMADRGVAIGPRRCGMDVVVAVVPLCCGRDACCDRAG